MVLSGAGLVAAPPAGPAKAEGEAGAGDEPGGVLPGQAFDAGGLGDSEPDRGDAGRAGLSAAGGDVRIAERDAQVRAADVVLAVAAVVVACADGASGRVMSPHRWLRTAACRSCARAARAVCRQMPSQMRACAWSQPSTSFPVLNVSSGQRRPAMVMKRSWSRGCLPAPSTGRRSGCPGGRSGGG